MLEQPLRKETCNSSRNFAIRLHLNNMTLEMSFNAQRNGPRLGNSITWNIPLSLWGGTVCERLYPVSCQKIAECLFLTRDWQIDGTEESLTVCEHVWPQEVTGHWNKLPEEINLVSYTALLTIHHFDLFFGWDVDKSTLKKVKAIIKPIFGAKSPALCKYTKVIMWPETFDLFAVDEEMRALCWKSGWWFRAKCPTSWTTLSWIWSLSWEYWERYGNTCRNTPWMEFLYYFFIFIYPSFTIFISSTRTMDKIIAKQQHATKKHN